MNPFRIRRRAEAGAALPFALVLTLVCAAVAAGSTLTHGSAQKQAQTTVSRERAFQAAEAGIDWSLLQLRCNYGVVPFNTPQTRTVDNGQVVTVVFQPCDTNGRDDDADGTVDEDDESDFTVISSTGRCAQARRTVYAVLSTRMNLPVFADAVAIASDVPILTLNGNAFSISGADHDIAGSTITGAPETYAITSEAPDSDLDAQIPNSLRNRIDGLGTEPSTGTMDPVDVQAVFDEMAKATSILLAPGTHTHTDLGVATDTGMRVVRCDGDLHLSANSEGAGVLLVDGNLTVSGSFSWTGIIIVTGTVTFTGTGREKVNGSVLAGEELNLSGNVDLGYSSTAVEMARRAVAIPSVAAWIDAPQGR